MSIVPSMLCLVWGFFFVFLKDFIYLFMRDREREREREREGEAGSMPGAQRGTRSRDPGIMPWAKGRHSNTEPPRHPYILFFIKL